MEWLGLLFDGNTDIPAELIKTVKFFDYVLTPITGVAIVWQMSKKSVIKDIFDIQADKFLVPTLTIQPLVENAIRHGICKKKEGGTVFVNSYEREKEYVIAIIDDGVGFDKKDVFGKAKKHFGIDNVKTRLEYCGGRLEINSEKNFGTTVTIRMPNNIRI
ncbi:MAG: hypothetical protein K6B51_04245 [Bacilli bacterium]|nr:hypothetical protein [Bacilli bacterium]